MYRFKCVVGVLFSIINNQKEVNHFEDTFRQLLGMQAYVLFTFDKAVSNTMRSILHFKTDELSSDSWKLFKKYENYQNKFHEEMYYNDFLKLITPSQEQEMLIRFVHCLDTGIVTCHGFSNEPFTTNVELTKCIKMYGREYCSFNEEVGLTTPNNETLCYKSNGRPVGTGSLEYPFHSVFLKRNLKKTMRKLNQEAIKEGAHDQTHPGDLRLSNPNVTVQNGLSSQFCHNSISRKFQANTEDIIVRKRQKIDDDKEFEIEVIKSFKLKSILERIRNAKDKHLK